LLKGAGDEGLFLFGIRRELGPCDPSNVRRAVRRLEHRGLVESEHGRVRLTFWGVLCAGYVLQEPEEAPDPLEEAREHRREVEAALDSIRAEEAEKRRALAAREALWEEPGRPPSRHSSPGPNQLRVIGVLVRYADDPQMGLPRSVVRQIACVVGEKGNILRAIRDLTRRGTLQKSKDGERLRLTDWRPSLLRHHVPLLVDPPLDDEKAEAILVASGEPMRVSCRLAPPWLAKIFSERG
ncbi:MAG: hypothetical protein M3N18_05590, partial [Actinomycetota bacterium]|nr:hypothetical protein [Actinomycetota bacterium]